MVNNDSPSITESDFDDIDNDVCEGDDADDIEPEEVEEPLVSIGSFHVVCNGWPWQGLSTVPLHRSTVFFDYPTILGRHRSRASVAPRTHDPYAVVEAQGRERPTLRFKIGRKCQFNSVCNAFKLNGFERTTTCFWNVIWSRHLPKERMAKLRPFQRVNHFPSTWIIGRKDSLVKICAKGKSRHGKQVIDFLPDSWNMPRDRSVFESRMNRDPPGSIYIIKPFSSSCGKGIHLTSKVSERDMKSKCVVSQYVNNPLLINKKKFDLRLYVVVTCFDPLVAYWHADGLVRFCTQDYSKNTKSLKKRMTHLTNYSVNKKSDNFQANEDVNACEGDKWSLKALKLYLRDHGVDDVAVWKRIEDLIVKTLILGESTVNSAMYRHRIKQESCFELFGFDVLFDENYKPWLMEVNIGPSVATGTTIDKMVKNAMMVDMFHLVGIPPVDMKAFDKDSEYHEYVVEQMGNHITQEQILKGAPSIYGKDARSRLSTKRRGVGKKKKKGHVQRLRKGWATPVTQSRRSAGKGELFATTEDLEVIKRFEEQYARRGGFRRIFPRNEDSDYALFETPKRKNTLLRKFYAMSPDRRHVIREAAGVYSEPRKASSRSGRPDRKSVV